MIVSINPTYLCNFRCDFCYLTPEQLSDAKKIAPSKLSTLLEEVNAFQEITHIDLYGGEVSVMPSKYLDDILSVIRQHYHGVINVNTNFSKVIPQFYDTSLDISVSWDYVCRERYDKVLNNIIGFPREVHILMLAGDCLIQQDVKTIIEILNVLQNVTSVEIKPYSSNQSNQQPVQFDQFEEFVEKWLDCDVEKNFEFINEKMIQQSIAGTRNAFSDDHIYITPDGQFAVLEFDENDDEYFLELDSMMAYTRWTVREHIRVNQNLFCGECPYYGHCLSEHLREVKNLEHSCNGFRGLLDRYKVTMT